MRCVWWCAHNTCTHTFRNYLHDRYLCANYKTFISSCSAIFQQWRSHQQLKPHIPNAQVPEQKASRVHHTYTHTCKRFIWWFWCFCAAAATPGIRAWVASVHMSVNSRLCVYLRSWLETPNATQQQQQQKNIVRSSYWTHMYKFFVCLNLILKHANNNMS